MICDIITNELLVVAFKSLKQQNNIIKLRKGKDQHKGKEKGKEKKYKLSIDKLKLLW